MSQALTPGSIPSRWNLFRSLFSSPTLRAAIAFGSAGAAFTIGNLMLAGSMAVDAYGRLALVISLFNIFSALAPMGLDIFLVRTEIAPSLRLLARAATGGVVVGLFAGAIAVLAYQLPLADGALLGLALIGFAIGATAGGILRSHGKVSIAFSVTNLSNWAMIGAGVVGLFTIWQEETGPLILLALPSVLLAAGGWIVARNGYRGNAGRVLIPWRETLPLLGLQLAVSVALQLERLIAPYTLGIAAVAYFNVLAAVAIFPFRTLAAAAGLMFQPQLKDVNDYEARLAVLRHETIVIVLALAAATVAVLIFAPWVVWLLTGGKYEIGYALLIAGCLNGCPKMLQVIPQAVVTAYGNARDLVTLNSLSWLSLATGTAGAVIGSQWGLVGLVAGTAIGSFLMLLPTIFLAARVLRSGTVKQ